MLCDYTRRGWFMCFIGEVKVNVCFDWAVCSNIYWNCRLFFPAMSTPDAKSKPRYTPVTVLIMIFFSVFLCFLIVPLVLDKKPLKCDICERVFALKSALIHHKSVVHAGMFFSRLNVPTSSPNISSSHVLVFDTGFDI